MIHKACDKLNHSACDKCAFLEANTEEAIAERTLESFISTHGFKLDPVPRDGNCWVTAICRQLPALEFESFRSNLVNYLISTPAQWMEGFVALNSKKSLTKTQLLDLFKRECRSIRKSGVWRSSKSNIEDLLLPAASKMLEVCITVYSSDNLIVRLNETAAASTTINVGRVMVPKHEHYHALVRKEVQVNLFFCC